MCQRLDSSSERVRRSNAEEPLSAGEHDVITWSPDEQHVTVDRDGGPELVARTTKHSTLSVAGANSLDLAPCVRTTPVAFEHINGSWTICRIHKCFDRSHDSCIAADCDATAERAGWLGNGRCELSYLAPRIGAAMVPLKECTRDRYPNRRKAQNH